jgi:hypothetical protein
MEREEQDIREDEDARIEGIFEEQIIDLRRWYQNEDEDNGSDRNGKHKKYKSKARS